VPRISTVKSDGFSQIRQILGTLVPLTVPVTIGTKREAMPF
jgi:hypothetical protein